MSADHIPDAGKKATPDTIITSEIPSGLDKCPFCLAINNPEWTPNAGVVLYECGTLRLPNYPGDRSDQTMRCANSERDSIRERVRELETDAKRYKAVRLLNASEFAGLLQRCCFQDLKFDDEVDNLVEKGTN